MQRLGFDPKPYTKRADDTPELMGTIDGVNYSVLFYRCDKGTPRRCAVYQFWAKFTGIAITAEKINQWNRDTWLAAAYLGDDGAVRIVLTQRLQGGVTEANFAGILKDWREVLPRFVTFIGFKKK